jgi:glucokinase
MSVGTDRKVIGVDLGATNVRAALVDGPHTGTILAKKHRKQGTVDEVMEDIFSILDPLVEQGAHAIGIGVPSVVDIEKGIVYDVQYIPSWKEAKEVPLGDILAKRYGLPVHVNNDANCFALGELYFGKGKGASDLIGLAIGTGLGAGIIIHGRLYAGRNCGAGEFGMIEYLDHVYEYYCTGSFFQNVHGLDGVEVFRKASEGDKSSQALFAEMGMHLGKAIRTILYAYDPTLIILGGSVRQAWPWFKDTMWNEVNQFAFSNSLQYLRIEVSDLENSAILGAAALHYDALRASGS